MGLCRACRWTRPDLSQRDEFHLETPFSELNIAALVLFRWGGPAGPPYLGACVELRPRPADAFSGGLLCFKFGARLCEPQQCPGNHGLFIEWIAFDERTLLRVADPRSTKVAHRTLSVSRDAEKNFR